MTPWFSSKDAAPVGLIGMEEKFSSGENKGTPPKRSRVEMTLMSPSKKKTIAKKKRKNAKQARRLNRK